MGVFPCWYFFSNVDATWGIIRQETDVYLSPNTHAHNTHIFGLCNAAAGRGPAAMAGWEAPPEGCTHLVIPAFGSVPPPVVCSCCDVRGTVVMICWPVVVGITVGTLVLAGWNALMKRGAGCPERSLSACRMESSPTRAFSCSEVSG